MLRSWMPIVLSLISLPLLCSRSSALDSLPQRMRLASETKIVVASGETAHKSYVSAICVDPQRRAPSSEDLFDGADTRQAAGIVIRRLDKTGNYSAQFPLSDVVGQDGWPSSVKFRGRAGPSGVPTPSGLDVEVSIPSGATEYTFEIGIHNTGVAVVGPWDELETQSPQRAKTNLEKSLSKDEFKRFERLSQFYRTLFSQGHDYQTPTTRLGQELAHGIPVATIKRLESVEKDIRQSFAKLLESVSDHQERLPLLAIKFGKSYDENDVTFLNSFLPEVSKIAYTPPENYGTGAVDFIQLRKRVGYQAPLFIDEFLERSLRLIKRGFSPSDAVNRLRRAYLHEDCYSVANSIRELENDQFGQLPIPSKYQINTSWTSFLSPIYKPKISDWAEGDLTPNDHEIIEYLLDRKLEWNGNVESTSRKDAFSTKKNKTETTVTAKRVEVGQSDKLHMHYQQLGSREAGGKLKGGGGDGIVVQREFPNGAFGDAIVIDTSCTVEGAQKILEKVRKREDGSRDIRLVVTHQDADHIGGLIHILDAADAQDIRIHEILIGKLPDEKSLSGKRKRESWNALVTRLDKDSRYSPGFPNRKTIAHWVLNGTISAVVDVNEGKGSKLRTLRLRTLDDVEIDLAQIADPKSANQTSLIAHVCFRGLRHLLTADADKVVLAQLVTHDGFRSAGFMKWPHHLWRAGNSTEIEEMLRKYRPHTIILSNRAAKHPEKKNLKAIEALVEKILGVDQTRILYTGRDGDIHVIVKKSDPLECLNTMIASVLKLISTAHHRASFAWRECSVRQEKYA